MVRLSRTPVIIIHIAGWLLFLSLPLAFVLSGTATSFEQLLDSWGFWQFCFCYMALFYLHDAILLPRLFHKGRRFTYAAVLVVLLLGVFFLRPFDKLVFRSPGGPRMEFRMAPGGDSAFRRQQMEFFRQHPPPMGAGNFRGRRMRVDISGIFLFVIVVLCSVAADIARRWRLTEQRAAQAEADKANAELSFLKAQINPHFLFNTLNNIYSMAVTRNENTAPMLMKLSNILRYVTEDVDDNFVSLQSEVDCISDFVDLQQLRLGRKTELQYTVTGNLEGRRIAPLILMSFIENLFKYGVSNHEYSHLTIKLSAEENAIVFFAQNRIFQQAHRDDRTGIGLVNTKKRLQHLYPGKHKLDITRENGMFTVDLILQD